VTEGPVFHVEPQGGLGNRMIQYMVALKFRQLLPEARISNVHLPEWDIEHPAIDSPGPVESIGSVHHVDLPGLAVRAGAGLIRRIECAAWGQRLENFLSPEVYRSMFCAATATPEFDARHLICPVRAAEILRGDMFYPLTPVEFYADIVAQTGLVPVFMGQTERNTYTDRLRARFPSATFLPSRGPRADFELIRSARNIVVGVSTFIWLAAWLSHAEQIFIAVSGLFNPVQYPAADLLPFGDPRYKFYLLPVNYGVPVVYHAAVHEMIAPFWRLLPAETLQRQLREAPRFDPTVEEMAAAVDPSFYLAANPDVAAQVGHGNHDGAVRHYREHGHRQMRLPFAINAEWYALRYKMAAVELAQGDYSSFAHHFVAVGRAHGYRPIPDAAST